MSRLRFSRESPLAVAVMFAVVWPPLGFTLGTFTLIGPVRWITTLIRDSGLSDRVETAFVLLLIFGLVGSSMLGALLLSYGALSAKRRTAAALVPAAVLGTATLALWAWMTPALMARGSEMQEMVDGRFTFGPYPSRVQLERLADDGYTHVISLLHPAVAPFEPKLLSDERDNIEGLGLELVHAPMLPWIGQNKSSLETIRAFAESDSGKFYVHCYLGRDRVGVVKRLVLSVTGSVVTTDQPHPITRLDHLERGPVHSVGGGIFVTPFPTPEEMLAVFQNQGTGQVVALVDPASGGDSARTAEERDALESVGIPLLILSVTSDATEAQIAASAERIQGFDGVTLVHAFRSDSPLVDRLVARLRGQTPQ